MSGSPRLATSRIARDLVVTTAVSPTVSVIIPCRNAATWLGETLESALLQHEIPIEIIVVDDGSTDQSVSVARAVGRSVQVISQPPLGVSAARNAGTAAAVGAYFQYLDADDLLEPGTLAARIQALETEGTDVALTPWMRWQRQSDGRFSAGAVERRRLSSRPDIDLLTDAWWPPGAILYRRTIVERIGRWREDLPIIQDARFLLDAALVGARFVHLERVGLRYREHGPESLSRRDPRAFVEDCYRSAMQVHDAWRASGSLDDARRRALVRVYGYVARSMFSIDRARFDTVLERIHDLDPEYLPEQPRLLRHLSAVIGYRPAEHVASWWRKTKAVLVDRA